MRLAATGIWANKRPAVFTSDAMSKRRRRAFPNIDHLYGILGHQYHHERIFGFKGRLGPEYPKDILGAWRSTMMLSTLEIDQPSCRQPESLLQQCQLCVCMSVKCKSSQSSLETRWSADL